MRGTYFPKQGGTKHSQISMDSTSPLNHQIYNFQPNQINFSFTQMFTSPNLFPTQGRQIDNTNSSDLAFSPITSQIQALCAMNQVLTPSFSVCNCHSFMSMQNSQSFFIDATKADTSNTFNCASNNFKNTTSDQQNSLFLNQRLNNSQRNFEAYYQVLNLMPFDDDEPVDKYKSSFSLESHLNLTIQPQISDSCLDITKPQTVPVNVTLNVASIENVYRPPLDIVCLVEKSQEMTPALFEIVRSSIHSLLNTLNDNDRLSLIFYDDFGYRVTSLNRMHGDNKETIRNALNNVYLSGGVDFADGLGQAMELLRQRKYINPTTCIMVIGASNDPRSVNTLEFLFDKYKDQKFYIHAFGCMDQTENVLAWAARNKNGAYHQIKQESDLENYLFEILTSLSQIQSHEAEVFFYVNNSTHPETSISKVYNDNCTCSIPEKCYKVKVPYLMQASKYEFQLELTIPELNRLLKPGEHLLDVLDVIYRVEALDGVIMKKETLQLNVYQDMNDESTAEQEQEEQDCMILDDFRPDYNSKRVGDPATASIEKVKKLIVVEELMQEANRLLQQNKFVEAKNLAARLRWEAQGLGMEFEMVIKTFLEKIYQQSQSEDHFDDLIEAN